MNRTQRILAVVLGLQIVLIAVIFWPRGGAVQAGKALLESFDPVQITRINIEDADGNRTTLAKSGQSWVLPEADDYPADAAKIGLLLQNLAAIQTDRLVTRTAASHKRLGVASDDFQRRVTLEGTGGASTVLYVGSSSGARATHVRLDGQDEVYLTGEISSFDIVATPSSWTDTAYVSLPGDQITVMRLENANGVFEFVKEATSGEWSFVDIPVGWQTNSGKISSLVSRLANLRMVQPLGKQEQPEYGFDQPSAIVTLDVPGENETVRTYKIEIGAKDSSGSDYFVRSSESEYIVRIAGPNLEELVNSSAEDFLQEEPTPTPGS
jgi:hypothetical protein